MRTNHTKGFSMVEIMIVISIISVLTTIAAVSYSTYREKARDRVRLVEVEHLAVAMRLYIEQFGADIDCTGGLKIDGSLTPETLGVSTCDDGAQILQFIKDDLNIIPHDPLGPGNADYYYYYDSEHLCGDNGATVPMVFASNLESDKSNVLEVCGSRQGNEGGFLSTTQFGGTIGDSQPYVKLIDYQKKEHGGCSINC